MSIRIRRLTREDLPLLHRWLHRPHVLKWWKEPLTLEEVQEKYGPRITGEEGTRAYAVLYGEEPVGYIQGYLIRDHPEYARCVDVAENAAGLDLFIGEADLLYQGLGPRILQNFLREVLFVDPEVESCILGPAPENRAAIRCYEKTGFRYLKTVQVPGEDVPEYLMRITRADVDR
jgi:RimJ/RimL family protein N-acetyltransferase